MGYRVVTTVDCSRERRRESLESDREAFGRLRARDLCAINRDYSVMRLGIEEDFLDPRFGIKYIGYPTLGLLALAVLLSPFSRQHALGVLVMAFGYITMGVGFVATVLYSRQLRLGT